MAGRLRLVRVFKKPDTPDDADGYDEPLVPPTWWASFEPLDPIASDGTRSNLVRLRGRYHPQITIDTHIVYGTRQLFVKGVQDIDDAHRQLVLQCEEIVP